MHKNKALYMWATGIMSAQQLRVWTLYDHPKDYPKHFVARLYIIDSGLVRATTTILIDENLDNLRNALPDGLACLDRYPDDDPYIIETWL